MDDKYCDIRKFHLKTARHGTAKQILTLADISTQFSENYQAAIRWALRQEKIIENANTPQNKDLAFQKPHFQYHSP